MNRKPNGISRGYVNGQFGQVHFWDTGSHYAKPTLFCLHATAYSGQTFLPLMERLGVDRHVVAIDTPGYGSSDGPTHEIDFSAYASAIVEAIHLTKSPNTATVDLFGFHTGALLATEIAALQPELVRRLILMGVPFFTGADKKIWQQKLVHKTELTESLEQFRHRWDYFISNRTAGLSLARAYQCFVDELRAYPREWWAHAALFDYAPETRLPLVESPTLILNSLSPLAQCSRAAANLMPHAKVIELPLVNGAPFDMAPEILAAEFKRFLDGSDDQATHKYK
jgi:pimeloyl-ACP methyl ester carboxylesterase